MRRGVLRDAVVGARSLLLVTAGRGSRIGRADLAVIDVPDTPLALEVERVARERQSPIMFGHALRSIAFAHAIAGLDRIDVDPELLWCACLLHDVELEHPTPGRCFAVRGGLTAHAAAERAGASAATAHALADAVSRHATAGLDPVRDPLPFLVAGGALVDVLAKRLEQLDRAFVREVLRRHPRDGFAPLLARSWRAEVRVVPGGRAAVAERTACFSLVARVAPVPGR